MTIILGIDPGSRITGYGLIAAEGLRYRYLDRGCIRTQSTDFAVRLKTIYSGLDNIIRVHAPQEVAIERVFFARNPDSALKLGQARGAAIVVAANHDLSVFEYSAREVKQAVVGKGAAQKQQVQHMVCHLLKLTKTPQEDAADALAIAICHAHLRQAKLRLQQAGWSG